ncbi:filamentous hemagglutinin [Plakobranchus ocellatus]|uniref:Filamentous hemagglutinin n=1 Tax=Plakobranchus ocellatus TaxID=259542 RepID=A0AAV4AP87_9GAST|nr:filamentous hemagglutinin [Plakobranchus ocellatus]
MTASESTEPCPSCTFEDDSGLIWSASDDNSIKDYACVDDEGDANITATGTPDRDGVQEVSIIYTNVDDEQGDSPYDDCGCRYKYVAENCKHLMQPDSGPTKISPSTRSSCRCFENSGEEFYTYRGEKRSRYNSFLEKCFSRLNHFSTVPTSARREYERNEDYENDVQATHFARTETALDMTKEDTKERSHSSLYDFKTRLSQPVSLTSRDAIIPVDRHASETQAHEKSIEISESGEGIEMLAPSSDAKMPVNRDEAKVLAPISVGKVPVSRNGSKVLAPISVGKVPVSRNRSKVLAPISVGKVPVSRNGSKVLAPGSAIKMPVSIDSSKVMAPGSATKMPLSGDSSKEQAAGSASKIPVNKDGSKELAPGSASNIPVSGDLSKEQAAGSASKIPVNKDGSKELAPGSATKMPLSENSSKEQAAGSASKIPVNKDGSKELATSSASKVPVTGDFSKTLTSTRSGGKMLRASFLDRDAEKVYRRSNDTYTEINLSKIHSVVNREKGMPDDQPHKDKSDDFLGKDFPLISSSPLFETGKVVERPKMGSSNIATSQFSKETLIVEPSRNSLSHASKQAYSKKNSGSSSKMLGFGKYYPKRDDLHEAKSSAIQQTLVANTKDDFSSENTLRNKFEGKNYQTSYKDLAGQHNVPIVSAHPLKYETDLLKKNYIDDDLEPTSNIQPQMVKKSQLDLYSNAVQDGFSTSAKKPMANVGPKIFSEDNVLKRKRFNSLPLDHEHSQDNEFTSGLFQEKTSEQKSSKFDKGSDFFDSLSLEALPVNKGFLSSNGERDPSDDLSVNSGDIKDINGRSGKNNSLMAPDLKKSAYKITEKTVRHNSLNAESFNDSQLEQARLSGRASSEQTRIFHTLGAIDKGPGQSKISNQSLRGKSSLEGTSGLGTTSKQVLDSSTSLDQRTSNERHGSGSSRVLSPIYSLTHLQERISPASQSGEKISNGSGMKSTRHDSLRTNESQLDDTRQEAENNDPTTNGKKNLSENKSQNIGKVSYASSHSRKKSIHNGNIPEENKGSAYDRKRCSSMASSWEMLRSAEGDQKNKEKTKKSVPFLRMRRKDDRLEIDSNVHSSGGSCNNGEEDDEDCTDNFDDDDGTYNDVDDEDVDTVNEEDDDNEDESDSDGNESNIDWNRKWQTLTKAKCNRTNGMLSS